MQVIKRNQFRADPHRWRGYSYSSRWLGERGRRAREQREPEMLRVEGDRGIDVVDHVSNVDGAHEVLLSGSAAPARGLTRPSFGGRRIIAR